jgi:ferric-dicitrate binding protein FerR (iron transport regulator)
MEHKRIIQLLTRKLANEATQKEIEELDELMALFPEAVYYEETLKQITFKDELPEETDIDQAFELHEQQYGYEFEAYQNHPSNHPNKKYFKRWLVAATLLVTCGFGTYFLIYSRLLQRNPVSYAPTTEIVCGKHMRKKITLPDGTSVWLNTNSKIQYDDAMLQKEHRDVRLYGEAFFDVAKDKKHPFIIHTQKITIKVLGTAFNVKAYPGDHITETTLIRGLIELSLNSNPQQRILLRPKEKLALKEGVSVKHTDESDKAQIHNKLVIENIEPVEISNKDYFEETSWVQNKLVFKDESFKDLVPKLEKWYNVTFQINNKVAEDYRFTGILENETISQALSEMQIIRPFKFKITANDKVIIN